MGKLFLRKATVDDKDFIFTLANNAECRQNSFSAKKIAEDEHEKWFEEVLQSRTKRLLVLMDEEMKVGQGRVDYISDQCKISYSIIPERRGYGYGRILILQLLQFIRKDFPQCKYSYGEVKYKNIASQKVFEMLNFKMEDKGNYFLYYKDMDEEPADFDGVERIDQNLTADIGGWGGVLLLSNNRNSFYLYNWLVMEEERVYYYSGKLTSAQVDFLSPSLIISYNYGYIIPPEIIKQVNNKIINLHISYLPWNKGSDPNFWSFIEDTPKGVTIHQLSEELDGGNILLQKRVYFDEKRETFKTTYDILNYEIVKLLQLNWQKIKKASIFAYPQIGAGSYHSRKELIGFLSGELIDWEETIYNFKRRKHIN